MESTTTIYLLYKKVDTKDLFTFHSWFSSKKSEEAAMEVGSNLIGIFKTNTKVFYKDTTENLTKYWTRGSYLVLR